MAEHARGTYTNLKRIPPNHKYTVPESFSKAKETRNYVVFIHGSETKTS